jgi:protein-tyrosine-phosphatase
MDQVLFVCVHNAGRSQMAKGLFNKLARERRLPIRAESAGTQPSDKVHRNVVEAMLEMGVDLSAEKPQLLTNDMIERARRVITMGCAVDSNACPAIFLKNVEDWGLPDPAGRSTEEVRRIRDTIRQRVEKLLGSMSDPVNN